MTSPETMSFAEFAKARGWRPSYVTELRKAGRLVLTEDGRRVRVAESLRLIEATRDPTKTGVAARHAADRPAVPVADQSGAVADAGEEGGDEPVIPATDPVAMRRAKAQADREEALLRKVLRDEQIELGELLRRDDVLAAVASATTVLRTSLETLPHTLAPELAAATSEDRVRVLLTTGIEQTLEELARRFAAIGKNA